VSADYSAEGLLADAILDHADDALARTEAALERYDKALAVVEAARKLNERHEARIGVCDDEPGAQLVIKALFAAWAPLGAALAAFDEVS